MSSPSEPPTSPNGSPPSSLYGQSHFDAYEGHAFRSAGTTMRIAGAGIFALGFLGIVATVLYAAVAEQSALLLLATPSVLAFAAGAWTRRAGRSLQEIALRPETQIPCLMSATADIQRVFRLLAILLIPGIALVVAGLLLFLATWQPPG